MSRPYGMLVATMILVPFCCAVHAAGQDSLPAAPRPVGQVQHALLPVPASCAFDAGELTIDPTFTVSLTGYSEPRLEAASRRAIDRLTRMTGIPLSTALLHGAKASFTIDCKAAASPVQAIEENEAYVLGVTPGGARLSAPSPYGILRGLETFLQLVELGPRGFGAHAARIEDKPLFPWRGLLIDVCRHWMPPEVVRRNLDAMAAVKLNVLHWHLSDDQAFRIESKVFPLLHKKGSDGRYYTQSEVREIIAYAAERGIRVVPEFDVPGHSTSWFVGYPELASAPGPYQLQRGYGIFDPAMDPSREEVYQFLDRFIGEMASLFPDPCYHLGGDEVTGKQWNAGPAIVRFKADHALKDNRDLQAYFNRRLAAIIRSKGKKIVGWDEVLHPDLPADVIVQSWRGQKALAEAARKGYRGLLSFGYYLDQVLPASFHYGVHPLAGETAALNQDAQARILGGEACIWAELVTPENIDGRIWPRAGAVAERLWSPQNVLDVPDMYRRLALFDRRLPLIGITHQDAYLRMLRRLAGSQPVEPLQEFAALVEPSKFYSRLLGKKYYTDTPLNRLVDAVMPESETARLFTEAVAAALASPAGSPARRGVAAQLRAWQELHARVRPVLEGSALLAETLPVAALLSDLASLGVRALEALEQGERLAGADLPLEQLSRADHPGAELLIAITPGIRRLVDAALALSAQHP